MLIRTARLVAGPDRAFVFEVVAHQRQNFQALVGAQMADAGRNQDMSAAAESFWSFRTASLLSSP